MKMSKLIKEKKEEIAKEWVKFVKDEITDGDTIGTSAARDDIFEMLECIVDDIESKSSKNEEKAKGYSYIEEYKTSVASLHGKERLFLGFTPAELSSEFRALRASIIKLWEKENKNKTISTELEDLIHLNETIDELWTHSVNFYHIKMEESKNWYLGILGHDLKNPLAFIEGASDLLQDSKNITDKEREIVNRIDSNVKRTKLLINNLLKMTSLRLGRGLQVDPESIEINELVQDVAYETQLAYPQSKINIDAKNSIKGKWDKVLLNQVMTNLLTNGIKHGEPGSVINVTIEEKEDKVMINVHNYGDPIPDDIRETLFAGHLLSEKKSQQESGSIGLGLYIVSQIIKAHQGEITFDSSKDEGTYFTVILPRVSKDLPSKEG